MLCGWEYSSRIPTEATFSRAFAEFAKAELPSAIHEEIVVENCHDELIGHASKDSTAIGAREKPGRGKRRTCKMKTRTQEQSRKSRIASEMSLTIAVYGTKPIAIGKEVYALKHDFSCFFKKKSQPMRQNWFDAEKINFLTR